MRQKAHNSVCAAIGPHDDHSILNNKFGNSFADQEKRVGGWVHGTGYSQVYSIIQEAIVK